MRRNVSILTTMYNTTVRKCEVRDTPNWSMSEQMHDMHDEPKHDTARDEKGMLHAQLRRG